MGRYSMTMEELMMTLFYSITDPKKIKDPNSLIVLYQIRFPRVIAVTLVGAGLGVSGTAYQTLFKNPLVSADVLGSNSGASFGAALALLFMLPNYGVQTFAFVFSIIAVLIATRFQKVIKFNTNLSLVLGGILVKSFFDSGLSMVKYLADPWDTLPAITFWLMGSFSSIKLKNLIDLTIPIFIAFVILFINRHKLDVVSFGDDEAKTMGVNVRKLRGEVIFASTLITASCISVCGQIGWVGLVVPHMARLLVGPSCKKLLPMSAFIGSIYLMIADNICRNLYATEIPIGIVTSLIGIPIFAMILKIKAGENI